MCESVHAEEEKIGSMTGGVSWEGLTWGELFIVQPCCITLYLGNSKLCHNTSTWGYYSLAKDSVNSNHKSLLGNAGVSRGLRKSSVAALSGSGLSGR